MASCKRLLNLLFWTMVFLKSGKNNVKNALDKNAGCRQSFNESSVGVLCLYSCKLDV